MWQQIFYASQEDKQANYSHKNKGLVNNSQVLKPLHLNLLDSHDLNLLDSHDITSIRGSKCVSDLDVTIYWNCFLLIRVRVILSESFAKELKNRKVFK